MNKQFVIETLGIDVAAISKEAMSVWKLVFEQVLLLAIHARQLYTLRDSQNYHPRMKLINILDDLSKKKVLRNDVQNDMQHKFAEILKMINENSGTNDIVKYLQNQEGEIKQSMMSGCTNNKQKILDDLEQQLVVFRGWSYDSDFLKQKFYSYYSLFKILKDPILIFQSLLSFPIPDEDYVADQIIILISDMLQNNLNQFKDFLTSNDAVQIWLDSISDPDNFILKNIETLGLDQESRKKAFVEEFTLSVKNNLAKYMSVWADYIFNQLTKPFFNGDEHPFKLFETDSTITYEDLKPISFFQEVCEVNVVDEKININIDKHGFLDILSLNQLPALSEQILLGLKSINFNKPSQVKFSLENKVELLEAFKMLAKWYEINKTGLFQNPNQLPKLMVMILDFDATYNVGLFSEDLNEYNHNAYYKPNRRRISVSAKERYNIITLLVSASLYYDEKSSVNTIIKNNKRSPEIYLQSILNASDSERLLKLFANQFMIDWTIFEKPKDKIIMSDDTDEKSNEDIASNKQKIEKRKDANSSSTPAKRQKQIIDRFKKMPDYLNQSKNKQLNMVSALIEKQKTLKKKSPIYPLNSGFPLPLWVHPN